MEHYKEQIDQIIDLCMAADAEDKAHKMLVPLLKARDHLNELTEAIFEMETNLEHAKDIIRTNDNKEDYE